MGILNSMFAKKKSPQQGGGNIPNGQTVPSSSSPNLNPNSQPTPAVQRYTELEAEISKSHQSLANPTVNQLPLNGFKKFGQRLLWGGILIGIPVGIVYVANLPYPVIRQPVAKTVPLLLLPSNMAMDANFKQGQASIEEARQLIESPTSPADLDRGSLKVKEGKAALDAIPVWYVAEWADYSRGYYGWGYDWRFTPTGLQASRIKAGQLEAKVFQEQNAQIELTNAETEMINAKTLFQQAATPIDQKAAIQNWQLAIDRLGKIPSQTMAGRRAQQLVITATRDLKELGGLTAGNEKIVVILNSAEEFAKQAAESGRNPPHSSERWEQIAKMWQDGIQRLESVPNSDLQGYSEAQKRLATYRTSLAEVQVRLKNEQKSVQALEMANQKLTYLWSTLPKNGKDLNRNQAIANFMAVNNELEKIQSGTTVYLQAQKIKLDVQNQLKLLQQAP
ncbi:hypothetical protein [Pseudanabaena sp. 'Roaring Creek']|uniref:hypothetical protein n=1 Tax=Pseudanabaena sp. 'Roaring Creek' TaxID=1681830 RepID=UPI0006D77C63|nr:hypothetical protein [Pseudanabaena sp. 'Roaring Creek']